jgi:hypothetical protein
VELWQSLLVAFGGNAALLLVLGFLGRSLLSTVLAKDVEKFKAALHQAGVEHQIRFSKLHEKRAEVLADLYKLLVAAVWQVSEFTSPMQFGDPDRKAQYAAAINAVAAYFRFFDQHRIWLPPELCEPLESFAKQLRTPAINLGVYLRIENPTDKTLKEQSEVWDKAWQKVDGDIPKLRSAIEAEFRKLLGATAD